MLVKWCRGEDFHLLPLWAGSNRGPGATWALFTETSCTYTVFSQAVIILDAQIHAACNKLTSLSSFLLSGLLYSYLLLHHNS